MKYIAIMFVFFNITYGQNSFEGFYEKDTIIVNYNKNDYLRIAYDSVKLIYRLQKEQSFLLSENEKNKLLSSHYKLDSLRLFSIPMYRILFGADKFYNCNSSIENFIAFNEHLKYQEVIVFNNKKIVTHFSIPDIHDEVERIQNPVSYAEPYFNDRPRKFNHIKKLLNSYMGHYFLDLNSIFKYDDLDKNFYFMIFGLEGVVCEVDEKTGLIYANNINAGSNIPKMLLNDYIKEYVGIEIIKQFSRSYYIDWYGMNTLNIKKCNNIYNKNVKVIINRF